MAKRYGLVGRVCAVMLVCMMIGGIFINMGKAMAIANFYFEYAKSFGNSKYDRFNNVKATDDGGYVVVGEVTSPAFPMIVPGFLHGGIIVKYNESGVAKWTGGGDASASSYVAVDVTSDGNYIVVTSSKKIILYNPDGVVLWIKDLPSKMSNYSYHGFEPSSVTARSEGGGFIITGGYNYNLSGCIATFDSDGGLIWENEYSNSGYTVAAKITSATETEDGIVAVGGRTSAVMSKGAFIVKYNSSGVVQWGGTFGGTPPPGSTIDMFTKVLSVVNSDEVGYLAVGYSLSTTGDMAGVAGTGNGIIVKYDSNGTIKWKKKFGGSGTDRVYSAAVIDRLGSEEGFVIGGYSTSTDHDFAGSGSPSGDAFLAGFDMDGTKKWVEVFGGSGADYFTGVDELKDGGIIAAGYSNSTNRDLSGLNKGDYDGIVVKYMSIALPRVKYYLGAGIWGCDPKIGLEFRSWSVTIVTNVPIETPPGWEKVNSVMYELDGEGDRKEINIPLVGKNGRESEYTLPWASGYRESTTCEKEVGEDEDDELDDLTKPNPKVTPPNAGLTINQAGLSIITLISISTIGILMRRYRRVSKAVK